MSQSRRSFMSALAALPLVGQLFPQPVEASPAIKPINGIAPDARHSFQYLPWMGGNVPAAPEAPVRFETDLTQQAGSARITASGKPLHCVQSAKAFGFGCPGDGKVILSLRVVIPADTAGPSYLSFADKTGMFARWGNKERVPDLAIDGQQLGMRLTRFLAEDDGLWWADLVGLCEVSITRQCEIRVIRCPICKQGWPRAKGTAPGHGQTCDCVARYYWDNPFSNLEFRYERETYRIPDDVSYLEMQAEEKEGSIGFLLLCRKEDRGLTARPEIKVPLHPNWRW